MNSVKGSSEQDCWRKKDILSSYTLFSGKGKYGGKNSGDVLPDTHSDPGLPSSRKQTWFTEAHSTASAHRSCRTHPCLPPVSAQATKSKGGPAVCDLPNNSSQSHNIKQRNHEQTLDKGTWKEKEPFKERTEINQLETDNTNRKA